MVRKLRRQEATATKEKTKVAKRPAAKVGEKKSDAGTDPVKVVHTRLCAKSKPVKTTPVPKPVATSHVKAEPVEVKPAKTLKVKPVKVKPVEVKPVEVMESTPTTESLYTLSELHEDPFYKAGDELLDGKKHSKKSRAYKRAYRFKFYQFLEESGGKELLTPDDIVAAKAFGCVQADMAASNNFQEPFMEE